MKTILVDDMLLDLQLFELKCADMPDFEIVGKFTDPNAAIEYAAGMCGFCPAGHRHAGDGRHPSGPGPAAAAERHHHRLRHSHPKFAVEALKMKADYIIFKPLIGRTSPM